MLIDRLSELDAALQSRDRERVVDLVDPYRDAVDAEHGRQDTLVTFAQEAQAATGDSEVQNACSAYLVAVNQATLSDQQVALSLVEYLEGAVEASEPREAIDDAIDDQKRVDETANELRAVRGAVSTPPILFVQASSFVEVALGSTVDEPVTVRNVGTAPAMGVEMNFEVDAPLDLSVTEVGQIGPDEETTLTIKGTPTESGRFTATVKAASSDRQASERMTFVVASKEDYIARAIEQLSELRESLESADLSRGNGTGKGGVNGLDNKLVTAMERLEDIRDDLGQAPARSVNNRIGATINLLEAFNKQARKVASDGAPVIRSEAEGAVETLQRARRAEV